MSDYNVENNVRLGEKSPLGFSLIKYKIWVRKSGVKENPSLTHSKNDGQCRPDEMLHIGPFHLGLHCMSVYPFRVLQYTKS